MPSKPLDASQVASKYEQYSMAKQAERKMRQLALEPQPGQYFADSQILAAQQAVNLFFCLPFMQQPRCYIDAETEETTDVGSNDVDLS